MCTCTAAHAWSETTRASSIVEGEGGAGSVYYVYMYCVDSIQSAYVAPNTSHFYVQHLLQVPS